MGKLSFRLGNPCWDSGGNRADSPVGRGHAGDIQEAASLPKALAQRMATVRAVKTRG